MQNPVFANEKLSWRSWREVITLAAVVLAILIPRGLALDRFVTADEHLWLSRSANFYFALTHADLASTYQKEHPGVTVMWAGTLAFLLSYPGYRGSGVGQLEPDQFHYYITRVKNLSSLDLLVSARWVLVLGNTLLLALCYFYARQLIGLVPALLSFLLIAFDPFHIALTRVFHLDGLASNLVLLVLLAFLHYLDRNSLISLVISGIAAGLGWLTKSPAFFVIPAVGLLALWGLWKKRPLPGGAGWAGHLWGSARPLLLWAGLGILVCVALWPALWVEPVYAVSQVIGRAQRYADQGHFTSVFFNGVVYEEGKIGSGFFEFYLLTYLWRTTPVVLLGLLLSIPGSWKRIGPFRETSTRQTMLGMGAITGIFLVGLTLSAKMADRYLLPVFGPVDLLAGLGWAFVFSQIEAAKIGGSLNRLLLTAGFAAVIGIQAALALSAYPYYFTYYNPILGGNPGAAQVMTVGWGEGIDQAARYLNQKPNAADLHVMAWYPAGSFNFIFKGHTRSFPYTEEMKPREWENFITSDYAVIYINQWQRQFTRPVLELVSNRTPEFTVRFNGLDYVRVYKIR